MSTDNCLIIAKISKKKYAIEEFDISQIGNINNILDFYDNCINIKTNLTLKEVFEIATDIMKNKYIKYGIRYLNFVNG